MTTIGVFDSGLGGLTVYRELKRSLPHLRYIYLGDTARTPYGSKSPATIVRYARECARFLVSQEVRMVVVACNTASSAALTDLEQEFSFPVVGTIIPAVCAALSFPADAAGGVQSIAVLGTEATIASGAYERALRHEAPELKVFSRACPLFVPLVEQGMYEGEIVEKVIELYLSDIRERSPRAVILGCTHYPLLKPVLTRYLGPHTKIIESSEAVADSVAELVKRPDLRELFSDIPPALRRPDRFFVTDAPDRFNALARTLLADSTIEAVRIEELE